MFLRLLSSACRKAAIINTHIATEAPSDAFLLSGIDENERLSGRWYREFPEGADETARESANWSSWENERSFWPMHDDLIDAISDAGFPITLQQRGQLGEMSQRVMMLALKS